jgi:hypothetical protein
MNEIIFWIISAVFTLAFYIIYLWSILKWETKPHIYTAFLYALLSAILLYLQINNGAWYWSIYFWITLVFWCIIFILSFKFWFWEITISDKASIIFAFIWIVLWLYFQNPFYSVVLFILVDAFSSYPMIRKTYYHPYTENQYVYLIEFVWIFFSILALSEFDFINAGYLFYIIAFDFAMFFIILLRRRVFVESKNWS